MKTSIGNGENGDTENEAYERKLENLKTIE